MIEEAYKTIYIRLKNSMGVTVDCVEFTYSNAKVVDFGDGYLNLVDNLDHLLFRCKLTDIDRFCRFN